MKSFSDFLGIDTSNYTTSAAIVGDGPLQNSRKLLPVGQGERGLRQSDAVFFHTKQISEVLGALDIKNIAGIGYAIWNGSNKDEFLDGFFQKICEAVKTVKETLRRNVRIICFSEEYLSMLMWSHYADNHKGFAIVYDKNDIEKAENYTESGEPIRKKSILRQVTYAEEQTDLTLEIEDYVRVHDMPHLGDVTAPIPNLSQDKLRRMMTEKSPDWSYEKEWRVIPRHISLKQESNLGYMGVKPKAVILGSKCSNDNRCQIIDICNGKRIPVFRADLNYLEPGYKLLLRTPDI